MLLHKEARTWPGHRYKEILPQPSRTGKQSLEEAKGKMTTSQYYLGADFLLTESKTDYEPLSADAEPHPKMRKFSINDNFFKYFLNYKSQNRIYENMQRAPG